MFLFIKIIFKSETKRNYSKTRWFVGGDKFYTHMLTLILLVMIRDEQSFKMVHSGKKESKTTTEMMLSFVNILSTPSSFM
jgi:hypothetical protein